MTLHKVGGISAKNLVVLNKGPNAVILNRDGLGWDLMEIHYHPQTITQIKNEGGNAEYIIFEANPNLRKFEIIKRIFSLLPKLEQYENVMMMDDDLVPVGCTISDIFSLFGQTGFRVGQPALTKDSYWSHEILLRVEKYNWRLTNFVEVMCPIMTMQAMLEYLDIFDFNSSGFGLDNIWSELETRKYGGVVVLDATPIRHSRPIGGGSAYNNKNLLLDRLLAFERFNLSNQRHKVFEGHGKEIDNLSNKIYFSQYVDLIKFELVKYLSKFPKIYSIFQCILNKYKSKLNEAKRK